MKADKYQQAKTYCRAQKYAGTPPSIVIRTAAEMYGLSTKQTGALRAFVYQHVFSATDVTLCGGASLKALTLPMNRISEAFV